MDWMDINRKYNKGWISCLINWLDFYSKKIKLVGLNSLKAILVDW